MEAINDSLKHVCQCVELIKNYLESNDIENDDLLHTALSLLEKTVESLSKSV